MVRMLLRFTGRVQGVGFRFFAQMNASKLHLTGWVRNERDGSVTVEAQGTKLQIDQFITLMSEGNHFVRVDYVEKKELAYVEGEREFQVRYY